MTWAIVTDSHIRAIGEMLSSGSERVLAVVGGALLEDTMYRTLSERFRNKPGLVDNILGIDKPLGNVSPQIDVLFLLGGISENVRSALKGIAGVRNFFAHDLDASFDSLDAQFSKAMIRLRLHENKTHYPEMNGAAGPHKIEPINNKRDQFTVNLKIGLLALMQDRISHEAHSNQPTLAGGIANKFLVIE